MAWNPHRVWFALFLASFCLGCWGCTPAKKTETGGKEKASSESPKPESKTHKVEDTSPKINEDTVSKQPEKTGATAESSINPIKPTVETSVQSQDDNPPPVPAPKPNKPVQVAKKTVKQPLPPPAAIPKVSLSDKQSSTCLIKVGDELPEGELTGIDGNKVSLKSLYGETLTVVFLWNVGATPYAQQSVVEMFADMQKDVLDPFAAKDLKVVGINVGNKPEKVKKALEKSKVKFPNLLDSQGDYFKRVATETLPRVYLLDGSGIILWFDIQYVRATRRELQTGIKAVLEGKK